MCQIPGEPRIQRVKPSLVFTDTAKAGCRGDPTGASPATRNSLPRSSPALWLLHPCLLVDMSRTDVNGQRTVCVRRRERPRERETVKSSQAIFTEVTPSDGGIAGQLLSTIIPISSYRCLSPGLVFQFSHAAHIISNTSVLPWNVLIPSNSACQFADFYSHLFSRRFAVRL